MKKILAIIFAFFAVQLIFAFPSLEPSILWGLEQNSIQKIEHTDEKQNILGQKLTSRQIIQTALEYSFCPVESEEGLSCLKKYDSLEKAVKKQFCGLEKIDAAEKLLLFLYDVALYRYEEDATRLNTTLLTGSYNCVTASILYLALARSLEIETCVQETNIHAYCSVFTGTKKIDVETTNPYGFNPGEKKLVAQSENNRKYAVIPKKYYAGNRQISSRAAATLTGKNIASSLNDSGDYETAIPLEISRLEFLKLFSDPETKTAKNDLDTLACNYAITQNRASQPEKALEFLEKVIQNFGNSAALQKTYGNSLYNAAVNLLNENRESDALELFKNRSSLADEAMQNRVKKMIDGQILKKHEISVHNQVVPLFNTGKFDEAKSILEKELAQNPESPLLKKDLQAVKKALAQ